MDTMDSIITRRSIRRYTGQEVAAETIAKLLRAGMYAPSAGNEQAWDFIVIKQKETMLDIMKVHPYSQMLREAGAAIVVCGNTAKAKYKDYWVQDCSAATQNILLAAHAEGLGAVWLGVYPLEDRVDGIKKILDLPQLVIPLSIISLGYSAETKEVPERYNENNVHYEQW